MLVLALPATAAAQYQCLGDFSKREAALAQARPASEPGATREFVIHLPEVGFNWFYRMPDNIEYPFWEYLRDVGGPSFVEALDWVGVDAYPGTFFPASSKAISKRNSKYGLMRDDYTPKPAFETYDKIVEEPRSPTAACSSRTRSASR